MRSSDSNCDKDKIVCKHQARVSVLHVAQKYSVLTQMHVV